MSRESFRPLAGISCVLYPVRLRASISFPSPRGDKLCPKWFVEGDIKGWFPSPRGDKLCLQNCPTGACGIRAGF